MSKLLRFTQGKAGAITVRDGRKCVGFVSADRKFIRADAAYLDAIRRFVASMTGAIAVEPA